MTVNSKELFYTVRDMNSMYSMENDDTVKLLNNAKIDDTITRLALFTPSDDGYPSIVTFEYENVFFYADDFTSLKNEVENIFAQHGYADVFDISLSSNNTGVMNQNTKLLNVTVSVDYLVEHAESDVTIMEVLSQFDGVDEIIQKFAKDPYALNTLDFSQVNEVLSNESNPILRNVYKNINEAEYIDNDLLMVLVKASYIAGLKDGAKK